MIAWGRVACIQSALWVGLLGTAGCSLYDVTLKSQILSDFRVDATDAHTVTDVPIDPMTNLDVSENRDRLKSAGVTKLTFIVSELTAENDSASGSGRIYCRPQNGPPEWPTELNEETATASFQKIILAPANQIEMAGPRVEALGAMIFPGLQPQTMECRIAFEGDRPAVHFGASILIDIHLDAHFL